MKLPFRFFKDHISVQGFVVIIMSFALLGVGFSLGSGWIFTLFSMLFALIVMSIIWPLVDIGKIEVSRSAPPRASVGEAARTSLNLTNHGRRAKSLITVSDDFLSERGEIALERLQTGKSQTVDMKKTCRRRGDFTEGEVNLSSSGPFGLIKFSRRIAVPSHTVIYPEIVGLEHFDSRLSTSAGESLVSLGVRGHGPGFFGVREFQHGDSLRSIHWRATARSAGLMIKEFEEEGHSPVEIFLDLNKEVHAGEEPDTSLEFMVKFAASIASHFLLRNREVNLNGACSKRPGRLEAKSIHSALDWLAGVEADGEVELEKLIASHLEKTPAPEMYILTTGTDSTLSLLNSISTRRNIKPIVLDLSTWDDRVEKKVDGSFGIALHQRGKEIPECWKDSFKDTVA